MSESSDPKEVQPPELSPREKLFGQFYESTDFQAILHLFESLCKEVGVDHTQYQEVYPSLKKQLVTWKAEALWQLLDARASFTEYDGQKACAGKKVLIIGGGPVGLRSAIEAALLGAEVDLVEKRDSFSRNNSLHLWPFLLTDLRNLGAKKFYGRFCSSSIDHICIRILQSILLKVCLLFGIRVYPGISFNKLIEPKNSNSGWTVMTTPTSCPVTLRNYDIIIGADGKHNSLGFCSKEFRAKLALAITVNFVNLNTKLDCAVPEISGVSYVYRQDFFNSLTNDLGIELENIVYYRDETHYFVMTAKKPSLLKKGVLKRDLNDPKALLSKDNIDQKALERYAVEATNYSTEGGLGDIKFEKNHRGQNDVALFDFTSLFAAENAARIIERKGKKILLCLAGDSLLEPFWPLGTGCGRGFLGAFDAAWMMKRFCAGVDPIDLLEEREAILYLLPQTNPERLHKNFASYSIDPKTRYVNMSELVPPGDVTHLYDTDKSNASKVNKNQNHPQGPTAIKTAKEVKHKRVTPSEEAKPKRSRSIEGLASKARSVESPFESSTKEGESSSPKEARPAVTTAKGLKNFWKTKITKSDSESTASNVKTKDKKDHSTAASNSAKPPLPSTSIVAQQQIKQLDAKPPLPSTTIVTQQKIKELDAKPPTRSSPQSKKDHTPTKSSSFKPWQRRFTAPSKRSSPSPRSASPEPSSKSAKKGKSETVKGESSTPKKVDSPKWPYSFGLKVRSRSESPERLPKKNQKSSSQSVAGHPLEQATSLRSLDKESENEATNVLDIIKQYDERDRVSHGQKVIQEEKGDTKKSATKGKLDKGSNEKKKSKPQKDEKKAEKESKEKESGSHKRWKPFSFFKSKKSYDVSTDENREASPSSKQKKKPKKEAKNSHTAEKPKTSEEESSQALTVQGRIDRMKELGIMTDGTDSPDVVLLSVSSPEDQTARNGDAQLQGGDEMLPKDVEAPTKVEEQPALDKTDTGEAVESQLQESTHQQDEQSLPDSAETTERVKKLQTLFQQPPAAEIPRSRSYTTNSKRSKEIDLSEVLLQRAREEAKPQAASHPLWLARVMQGLNKCLERLRKDNDVKVAKTALEIINTILSNVHSHPDNDVYRRVRISSERFHNKVWQYSDASQFLARSGWVELFWQRDKITLRCFVSVPTTAGGIRKTGDEATVIEYSQLDDFIVLPIGSGVDLPKRVLDKHLDIVNQMLWSMQLEIPDSPGVVKCLRMGGSKSKGRAASLKRRESYATKIVEESLERIDSEQDQRAMAAALARRNSGDDVGRNDPVESNSVEAKSRSSVSSPTGLQTLSEEGEGDGENGDKPAGHFDFPAVRQDRLEELQTMKAASAARTIWTQRGMKYETKQERDYKLILETELYDLPQNRQLSVESNASSVSAISNGIRTTERNGLLSRTENGASSTAESSKTTTEVCTNRTAEQEICNSRSPVAGARAEEGDQIEDKLRRLTSRQGSQMEERKAEEVVGGAVDPSVGGGVVDLEVGGGEGVVDPNVGGGVLDQNVGGDVVDAKAQLLPTGDQREMNTDAQYSTHSSIKSDMLEYEKITLEAAAQTRQKWKQNEASSMEGSEVPSSEKNNANNSGDEKKLVTVESTSL